MSDADGDELRILTRMNFLSTWAITWAVCRFAFEKRLELHVVDALKALFMLEWKQL